MRRRNLLAGGAALATIGTTGLARPAIAQGAAAKVLRFVPQADLANPDPIWTTATVATNHGYMVWDTLYGINDALIGQPQMCAGHEVSSDELTWTFTLRDGLKFTDGEPVRGVDCTTSIARWAMKNPFGQQLSAQTEEMKPLDDKRFQIRLKKRFRQMTYALGSQGCFVMPERMAKTPASEQIKEFIGSGPFIFKRDEWSSGSKAVYVKNPNYVPRQEKPEYYSGGKVANFERVEWFVQPDPATAAAALQTGEVDWLEFPVLDLLPMLRKSQGCDVVRYDPLGSLAIIAFNHLFPPFDNPKLLRALLPAIDQQDYVTAWVGEQQDLGKYPVGFFTGNSPMENNAGMDAFTLQARSGEGEEAGGRERIQRREDRDDGAVRSAVGGRAVAGVARSVHQAGAQCRLPGDGLGHAGGAPGEDGPAVAGRLERVPHHLGRARDLQSRQLVSAARQRQAGLVRLADRRPDGGTA